ncbi:MAG: serine hydrolase domain-containing protein, partial [Flavitalea sp.]
ADSITPTTPFHLASVSKTITATAVLRLVQEGKVKLNDPLAVYLPAFPLPEVTVKSLLNHRSGLPNYVHYMDRLGWDKKKQITNQDVLDFIVARQKDIDIGTANRGFSYSNTNYALLALLIEKVSGENYGQFLQTRFFGPLGMKDSYAFTIADTARSLPSYFYNGRQYAFDFLDLVYGDKNVYSTVRDMLKFDQALYNGSLVSKPLLDSAYSPYSFEKPGTHNYGLGWRMLLLKNGKKVIYHNGWWHGNRTAFYRLIDENVTIIAFCNNDSKMIYKTKDMADIFGNYFQAEDAITKL